MSIEVTICAIACSLTGSGLRSWPTVYPSLLYARSAWLGPVTGDQWGSAMTCVPVTPQMAALLEMLRTWPDVDLADLRSLPEWEQARLWGWVMESGELTGSGAAHAGELPGGLVRE